MSSIVEQVAAPLAHVTLTADEAEAIAEIARARVLHPVPAVAPGLATDKNADLWQISPGPVFQRLTLTAPEHRGTGIRQPYLGGAAPDGWGITDAEDPREVQPFTPLGGPAAAAPAEPAPAEEPGAAEVAP